MSNPRNTNRKRIIREAMAEFGEMPVVLEELRWRVMQKELQQKGQRVGTMSESYQKSFNRSLRSFLATLASSTGMRRIASSQGGRNG